MASFVEKCNCRGMSVKGVLGTHHNLRPEITGKLLQERHVARYIVAPQGYGKSAMAYEYAQIVFGFNHTFWIPCTSPCFMRDLDRGTLAEQIMACDPHAALVVFDDVPHLDFERSAVFDAVMSALLAAGVEAIATCTPSVDTFSSLQADKVVLKARDLLLTDEELSIERLRGNLSGREGDIVPDAARAACLVWGVKGAVSLLKGFKTEELPGDLRLAALLVLLLAEGTLSDVAALFAASRTIEDIDFLEDNYPFLGVDSASQSFEALAVDVHDIATHLGFSMRELALSAGIDADALCERIADTLLERGRGDRASAFIRLGASKAVGSAWLAKVGWTMVLDAEPLAVEDVFAAVRKHASSRIERISTIGAWAAFALGDIEAMERRCRGVMRSAGTEWQDAAACLMLAAYADGRFGMGGHRLEIERIERLQRMQGPDRMSDLRRHDTLDWGRAVALMRACCSGDEAFMDAWDEFAREDAEARVHTTALGGAQTAGSRAAESTLALFGAWHAQGMAARGEAEPSAREIVGRLCAGVCRYVLAEDAGALPKWVCMLAVEALARCADMVPDAYDAHVPAIVEAEAMHVKSYLSDQAAELVRMREKEAREKEEYRLTHPDPFRSRVPSSVKASSIAAQIPLLRINLFGGFDVRIEDDARRPCSFRRNKAKLALAMLAINRGREMSRWRITETLWPDTTSEFRKRNFYVIWSSLKKELAVNGSCPYLLRSQTGYRLDARFVATDLDAFDRLCRSLLFGGEDVVSWEDVFEQVTRNFSDDFLPDVADNEFIAGLRERYRDQLIDGLISASTRLAALGELRGSLWFAREALRRDELREDSYMSLMKAQIASNQRGAALETYFTCRRMLTEKLGIDPSPGVVELYTSIIESEEAF